MPNYRFHYSITASYNVQAANIEDASQRMDVLPEHTVLEALAAEVTSGRASIDFSNMERA